MVRRVAQKRGELRSMTKRKAAKMAAFHNLVRGEGFEPPGSLLDSTFAFNHFFADMETSALDNPAGPQ